MDCQVVYCYRSAFCHDVLILHHKKGIESVFVLFQRFHPARLARRRFGWNPVFIHILAAAALVRISPYPFGGLDKFSDTTSACFTPADASACWHLAKNLSKTGTFIRANLLSLSHEITLPVLASLKPSMPVIA